MKLISLVLLLALLQCSIPAMAADSSDWKNVLKLKQGTDIAVTKTNGEAIQGKFGVVVLDELAIILPSKQVVKVNKPDIAEVKKLRDRGKGILIGLAVGTGCGYLTGKMMESDADRAEDPGLVPLYGSLVGAGLGALFGAGGSSKVIYTAR